MPGDIKLRFGVVELYWVTGLFVLCFLFLGIGVNLVLSGILNPVASPVFAIGFGLIIGVIAHEASHYIPAWFTGRRPAFRVNAGIIRTEWTAEVTREEGLVDRMDDVSSMDHAIGATPVFIGWLVLAPLAVYTFAEGGIIFSLIYVAPPWAIFTLPLHFSGASLDDYRYTRRYLDGCLGGNRVYRACVNRVDAIWMPLEARHENAREVIDNCRWI